MAVKKFSKAFFFSTTFLLAGLQLENWVGKDAGFRVQKVMITGCQALRESEVLAVAKVPLQQSIFEVEFTPIAKRVATLPYVQRASVSRIFPSTLVIAVQERRPLALINHGGLWPIDEEGVILPRLQSGRWRKDLADLDTPVLSGGAFDKINERKPLPAAAKRTIDFLAGLRADNAMLYHSISELSLNSQGALTLYLMEGGVPVYLGSGQWMEKCDRLFIFLQHAKPSPEKLFAIDLRYDNQIVTKES